MGEEFNPGIIPSEFLRRGLSVKSDDDLSFLGRRNLNFLVGYWNKEIKKRSAVLYQYTQIDGILKDAEKKIQAIGGFISELDENSFKSLRARIQSSRNTLFIDQQLEFVRKLRKLAQKAEPKPQILSRPPFKVGHRVTIFVTNDFSGISTKARVCRGAVHGRVNSFINGTIVSEGKDPSGKNIIAVNTDEEIRTLGLLNDHVIIDVDSIGLMQEHDFSYFKEHPDFFDLYLKLAIKDDINETKVSQVMRQLLQE